MAMFGDRRKRTVEEEPTTETAAAPTTQPAAEAPRPASSGTGGRIGSSIQIKGELSGNENLVIDGVFEGSISLNDNDLTIGQSGKVKANISAKVITIEGELNGDMFGKEKVILKKTGRVRGNIVAPRVTLEDGAKFKGSIDMDPSETGGMRPRPAVSPSAAGSSRLDALKAGAAGSTGSSS